MTVVSIRESIDRTYERMNDAIESQHLLESFTAPRPSTAERLAAGKALRDNASRKAQRHYPQPPAPAAPAPGASAFYDVPPERGPALAGGAKDRS